MTDLYTQLADTLGVPRLTAKEVAYHVAFATPLASLLDPGVRWIVREALLRHSRRERACAAQRIALSVRPGCDRACDGT